MNGMVNMTDMTEVKIVTAADARAAIAYLDVRISDVAAAVGLNHCYLGDVLHGRQAWTAHKAARLEQTLREIARAIAASPPAPTHTGRVSVPSVRRL